MRLALYIYKKNGGPKELVVGGAAVHVAVGYDGGRVADAHSYGVLHKQQFNLGKNKSKN